MAICKCLCSIAHIFVFHKVADDVWTDIFEEILFLINVVKFDFGFWILFNSNQQTWFWIKNTKATSVSFWNNLIYYKIVRSCFGEICTWEECWHWKLFCPHQLLWLMLCLLFSKNCSSANKALVYQQFAGNVCSTCTQNFEWNSGLLLYMIEFVA